MALKSAGPRAKQVLLTATLLISEQPLKAKVKSELGLGKCPGVAGPKRTTGLTCPVAFDLLKTPRTRLCGCLGKLWSETTPATTGASAAGIFTGVEFAKCCSPLTSYMWMAVWKADCTPPAVPVNSMIVPPAETRFT